MSAAIGTPVNQIRLTNVAYVRLQKKGKRFEIACYRNKVLSWRSKVETDLSEVLQIDTVFCNVSKGNLASSKDLLEAFGTADQKLVCREILEKGEMQVSEQERGALYESMFRDVAAIVVDKSVNPENNRPYTISMILNAMKQLHFSVNTSKSAKSQALDVIRKLRDVMPIARACMLLRVTAPAVHQSSVRELLSTETGATLVEERDVADSSSSSDGTTLAEAALRQFDVRVDPEVFRVIQTKVPEITAGKGLVEVLQLRTAVAASGGAVGGGGGSTTAAPALSKQPATALSDAAAPCTPKKKGRGTANEGEEGGEEGEEDEEEEEEEVLGMVKKEKKKKAKKKAQKTQSIGKLTRVDEDKDEEDEEGEEGDGDGDGDDGEEAEHVFLSMPGGVKKAELDAGKGKGKANLKGKKSKRIEKEQRSEQESKMLAIRSRMEQDAAKTQAAIAAASSASASLSTDVSSDAALTAAPAASTGEGGKTQGCTTCKGSFSDPVAFRNHFKSEWHRFNLKNKLENKPPLSEEEFNVSFGILKL